MHRPNRETPADAYTAINDPRHADGSFPGHRLGSIQISCRHLGRHDLGVNPNLIASFSPPEACFLRCPCAALWATGVFSGQAWGERNIWEALTGSATLRDTHR
ncbi:hypothetical protein MRX96_058177 [Rhipicephalus microplus]